MKKIALMYSNKPTQHYQTEHDMFVALDEQSGGYPYRTNGYRAENFKTSERAQQYLDKMSESEKEGGVTIVELSLTIVAG